MEIIKISLIGISCVFVALMFKNNKSEYAQLISLAAGIVMFVYVIIKLDTIIELINSISNRINIEKKYLLILIKMTGITYVAEFASSICRDAGFSAIAGQIDIFAKVSLLIVSLPVITALLETIGSL